MTRARFSARWVRCFLIVTGGTVLALAGCGQQEPKRITAASSGLQAEEAEEAAEPRATPNTASPFMAQPAESTYANTGNTTAAKSPPREGAPQNRSANSAPAANAVARNTPAARAPGEEPTQPRPIAADSLNPYAVPEGTPAELLAFVDQLGQKLQRQDFPATTHEEALAQARLITHAQYEAAEKAYSQAKDAQTRTQAVQEVIRSLTLFESFGGMNMSELIKAFGEKLMRDPDPGIAQQGHSISFSFVAGDIGKDTFNRDAFFKGLEQVLAAESKNLQLYERLIGMAGKLQQAGMTADAAKAFRMIGGALAKTRNRDLVDQAGELIALADILEADLDGHLKNMIDGKPDAVTALLAAVEKLLAKPNPSSLLLTRLISLGNSLEYRDQNEAAGKVYAAMTKAFSQHPDPAFVAMLNKLAPNFEKRMASVGQPLALVGTLAKNVPLDPKKYAGKPVLLYFWTMGSLLPEDMSDLELIEQQFADRGFTVLGVCIDNNSKAVQQRLANEKLPWDMLYAEQGKGFDQPIAAALGIDVTPAFVLVGADGKVISHQARGEKLQKKLTELLGPPAVVGSVEGVPANRPGAAPGSAAPGAAVPGGEAPAPAPGERPAVVPPEAAAPPATRVPDPALAPGGAPQANRARGSAKSRVAIVDVSPFTVADDAPAATKKEPAAADAKADKPADKPAEKPATEKKAEEEVNPYSADPDLSPTQLADFILEMRDKPAPIQERPGFLEAVLDASERVLANPKSPERFQLIAISSMFEMLHARACLGDEKCQEKLTVLVERMAQDKREPVVKEVTLLRLEERVLAADKLPLDQIPLLVKEVQTYCEKEPLTERHLRLASSTVKAVNRLPNADERDKHFAALGGLYAKSEFKRLARYGKKLVAGEAKAASDYIGRPMELAGTTAKGDTFDWKGYRGKVVLVDFWATWCGPCRAEMPHVKELFEKHEKDGFDVVGVSLDKDEEALSAYLEENSIPWSTLAGESSPELAEKYGVEGIPTMFLIDQEGKVVAVSHNVAELEPKLAELLKKKS